MTKPVIAALVVALSFSAYAAETKKSEGQTTLKADELKEKNKVAGDIDEDVTNARMRAESGSKSKWSISTTLNYKGGSLKQGFGAKRPNLSGKPGEELNSSISIDPNVRFRWSKNDSVTLGNSFAVMTPFQGRTTKNQLNWRDPALGYNRVGKLGVLQTSASVSLSAGTSNESKALDNMGGIGTQVSGLYSFQNGLTLGTAVAFVWNHYTSKPGQNTDPRSKNLDDAGMPMYGGDARNQYDVAIYPFLEYTFTDKLSFRTVFGYFNWSHTYGDPNKYRLLQSFVYQSMGVGISVSRDIYLYPNVQFVPDNIRSDFTNVAMSAMLNVF